MELTRKNHNSPRRSRSADAFEDRSILREQRAPEHGDTCGARNGVDEQLQPLPAKHSFTVRHSGEVTAGMRKTLDDSKPDRVRYESEHDRDHQPSLLECEDGWRSDRDDYIRLLRPELSDKSIQPIGVSFAAEQIDSRCVAVLVANFAKRFEQEMDRRAVRESAVQYDDPRPLPRQRRLSERYGK